MMDGTAVRLTLQLATCTTAILLVLGLPLSHWLATTRWRGRFLIDALVSLPLVLPPTVVGFSLLIATGPNSFPGRILQSVLGYTLPFSFTGVLVASVIYNVPFAVRPFTAALAKTDRRLLEASWCLGENQWMSFWRVTLPLSWQGILAGMVLTFAHCVGEFGVVLMVGGNIPGVTRTLSIAIYDDVQALDYASAHTTAFWLLVFSFAVLCLTHALERRSSSP